ncbi:UNVERIFIED_CONTAM: hypothetical protein PYX00_007708 [Menopon gallinae]|uniref:Cytochrome P450 n=1 Tax=Menopon gallinae TaxID=328185 RepID=A0AAW2HLC8_9NEOP
MENPIFGFAKILLGLSVIFLTFLYIHFRLIGSKYFSRRNIPHLKPIFLLGNLWRANLSTNFLELLSNIHVRNRRKKILGLWLFTRPNLMVMDTEIVKRILIKDFRHFRDRGLATNEDLDPLTGHLLFLNGKRWRNLRVKLIPTFTSGKMKMMFPAMSKCGKELQEVLKKPAETGEVVEVKDILARYATDVISSCAFGIETNSLQNPKSEFREYGRKMFKIGFKRLVLNSIAFTYPKLGRLFKIRVIPKDVSDFFINIVRETVEYREKTQTKRNDFLQLLIQLIREGKIEDVDKTPVDGLEDEEIVRKFSLLEAAAQCFIFFGAGFESSSSALTFCLYELALNPDIQKRLQDEIDSTLIDCDNEMTYETLLEMEYLDKIVLETLRKYPPIGILQRQSEIEYHIPEMDLTLDKGTAIVISVWGTHRDPDLYPEPDKFDPERFSPEEKAKRDACAYLPFGEGPRNCIGSRFAMMQLKIALYYLMNAFSVEVTSSTPIPVAYDVGSFVAVPVGGMNLRFKFRW